MITNFNLIDRVLFINYYKINKLFINIFKLNNSINKRNEILNLLISQFFNYSYNK